jgi:acetoin utilization protein AcuB
MTTFHHLTVRDLMTTALVTVHPDASIGEALETMRMADIRHLPVTDRRGRLVGIVSDRDLLHLPAKGKHAAHRVEEVMSRDVLSVAPGTLAREAAALLLGRKIGALPVLDDELALVGVITETDFLRLVVETLGGAGIAAEAQHD